MPTQKETNAIHPVVIMGQAWSLCRKNLGRLSLLYLIFNLPITFLAMTPMIQAIPAQKFTLAGTLWFLLVMVVSSWGHITLLFGVQKALDGQISTVGHNINQAQSLLGKYLLVMLSITLFIIGTLTVSLISAQVVLPFLAKVNNLLAFLVFAVLLITVLSLLVFFILRWSLAALACIFEGAGPRAALKSSFALIKDHINPVVGVYGLMMLVYILLRVFGGIIAALSGAGNRGGSLGALVITVYLLLINIVVVPLWTAGTVVLYRKLKEV